MTALRVAVLCLVAMLLIGLAAAVTARPFIFPSLGPTAITLFSNPLERNSSPRHVLLGHLVGTGAGYLALALAGLNGCRSA